MPSSIGIDLGTTYCCVASYKNLVVKVVETQASENTTPSFVAFDEGGSVVAGLAAKNGVHLKTENCLFAVKRILGRKFSDPGLQEDMKHWPFEIIEGFNDTILIRLANGDTFRPEQISAKLLSFLRVQAENFLAPETVKRAVITVPAHFNDGQRQATKDAGEIAGFEEVHILNEPTAAAIAYNHLNNKFQDWKTILVFDLGGGTLDVSIMKMKNKEIVMLGVGGDTHLGGEDFDNALVDYCVEEFKKKDGIDLRAGQNSTAEERQQANKRLRRLKMHCEKTKISLSATKKYPVSVEAIYDDVSMHINITRDTFETLNTARFDKCIEILERAIKDANLDKTQIDEVILVGGSSKIPAIQDRVTRYFGMAPSKNIKCSEAIAFGAAIQANIDNQYSESSIKINDICPISIGIEIFTKGTVSFSPIIPKNTPVPCTITQKYHIPFENMKTVAINVFEGENSSVKNNNLLGSFIISNLPENCSKGELLEVTMELSPEGILRCTANCPRNFATNRLEVMGSKGRLSREEIERMKLEEQESVRRFFE